MGLVDVRDVSTMHLEGLRRPEAANKRFIAYSERIYPKQVVDWLHEEFGPKGYTVPRQEAAGERDREVRTNTSRAQQILGIKFISAKDSVIAMAQSLIDHGIIKPLQ